ncbi:MAG: nucleotidyltransferase domain-containing protein, partial [Bdellovibrionaceae bacterium]|nr:nucleotidyltransferase domain-containing protein [Pseudobdellovibrionaceae bacterium]
MTRAKYSPLYVTKDLIENRYKGAEVIFLAGSVMRGEASTYSDVDIVVVFPKVDRAYRESFYHLEWPVEAFVHDPETLRHFFQDIDRPEGNCTLAEMVHEGIATPEPSSFSEGLKAMAAKVLREGPPPLARAEIDNRRYMISELVDDVREPRSRHELVASATRLYAELADFFFRSSGLYSASGKAILKRMKKADPAFFRQFTESFDALFMSGQT